MEQQLSFDGLTAEINSGHFYVVSGEIDGTFVYASKAPYSDTWTCQATVRGSWVSASGSDFVEAIVNVLERRERYIEIMDSGKRTTVPQPDYHPDGNDYDPDCPYCLRGTRHTNQQHEAALRRVYEASR